MRIGDANGRASRDIVRRLSLGAALYTRVMGNLAQAAKELLAGDLAAGAGESASASKGLPYRQLSQAMQVAIAS